MNLNLLFNHFAKKAACIVGNPWGFTIALLLVVAWLISGPIFNFSDTWQLIINTSTTIITFIIVFLLQNTQNRDTEALQIKLDELIKVHKKARNAMIDLEKLSDEELEKLEKEFKRLSKKKPISKSKKSA